MPMFSSNMLAQIIRFYGHAMQGIMGSYLEKNIQAFMEIQQRMAEQSKGLYGSQFGPEAWTQFMNVQTPMLQKMMNNYIDQSKNLFVQMQDQMQDQTRAMFSNFRSRRRVATARKAGAANSAAKLAEGKGAPTGALSV